MTTTNTKTIPMGVSNTILTKAPRFFGSSRSILTELFQNSFRAGAENVRVTWNPEIRTLEFKDDGRGCQPEDLIVVGGSGWSENSPAVDPAGIGVFSILRPEYCEEVTYRSKNWEMTLAPANLERAQVDVQYHEEQVTGMTITITLTPKADFARQESIQRARGRYPINVVWQELPKDEVAIMTEPVLDTVWMVMDIEGIGTLEIGKKNFPISNIQFAVWQHATLKSDALQKALESAAAKHSNLAKHVFAHINCVLDVEPASGIRPKLPDRNDLIDDNHLDVAAEKIVTEVMEHLLKPLHPGLWPNDVNDRSYKITLKEGMEDQMSALEAVLTEVPEDATIRKIINVGMGTVHAIMYHFGYKHVSWDEITEYSYYTVQDDGMQLEMEWQSDGRYVRSTPVMAVSNEVIAQSLCNQGVYAEVMKDVRDRVRILGKKRGDDGLVTFAKSIHVNGTRVQWLINDDSDNRRWAKDDPGPIFFTSLSPAKFYKS
ncbi:MAG TPA: ATP-binding protein, partial [Anaerolineales bacterium]|nr:ATP-binding protein [Anaerolineales bacterium]